ncbi:MAG: rod shape-determining protein MreD [Muribaculaceae bacterium]|nr:rod shape-determining protein MreD [Muribaculaceae bacterium]
MARTVYFLVILSLVLLLTQVVIWNHICLFNVAVPLVYIYIIMKLPVSLHVNWVMTIGFLCGLFVDVFADTYGINALSMTLMSALRRPVMRLYLPRDASFAEDALPSIRVFGTGVFVKYALTLTLIFCILVFVIEAFAFMQVLLLLMRIFFSTLLTFILILAIESIFTGKSEKRLQA